MTEPAIEHRRDWFVMLSPGWQSTTPATAPRADFMVGGWPIEQDGSLGPFHPNPRFAPNPDTPTDPVDAVLRLIAAGRVGDAGELIERVRHAVVEIACDAGGSVLVGPAPDEAPVVVVITAAVHRRRVPQVRWVPVVGADLPSFVPPGVDILLNPGGIGQFRLFTRALVVG